MDRRKCSTMVWWNGIWYGGLFSSPKCVISTFFYEFLLAVSFVFGSFLHYALHWFLGVLPETKPFVS